MDTPQPKSNQVLIIAEAGVNHNGDLNTAFKLIDAAARAQADAVKFQTFRAEDLVRSDAPKAAYQKQTSRAAESQYEMIRKLELDKAAHHQLIEHCRGRGILFLSSPFDLASINLLAELGIDRFKIPSGEINNLPYLRKIGSLNREIILSTGMSDLDEIAAALALLRSAGQSNRITLLHCNTEYPTPMEDVNLRAMSTLRENFNLPVGYSDHTSGTEVAIAAVALGASVIEKHFTLDRNMEGPDHKASLEPEELEAMVKAIRLVSLALGDGVKKPSASETRNMAIARKSIVAARPIHRGEVFSETNLTCKRPALGINPMLWDKVTGTRADRDYLKDDFIALPSGEPASTR